MTSPSAQKAADGLKEMLLQKGELSRHEVADLFQQAITEAVDAAVAQERERYKPYLRHTSKCDLGAGHYKDGVTRVCDCGLEAIMGEK